MTLIQKAQVGGAIALLMTAFAPLASAAETTIEISVKDNKFQPAEMKAPAGTPIVFKVKNLDGSPVEFESEPLEFETVIKPNMEGVIKVKAQKPGRYEFFDDFHQGNKGTLVVE
ncbi:cupredoxin domain-containing protein [Bradyrhizobium ontarionense]|uniref:Cupredoxin domain-containing protein n=1 Tax=Bradyrhizobium ontarionense TaxID=2898149 RepID=A0ABY3R7P0_9BRAD|nr:cupredoxin domain-containing protein [Bradyrhizobium sp. A19]UFZ03346.1 cupredoxin domain-containing protein [Bradyrhizobium sp. A19]